MSDINDWITTLLPVMSRFGLARDMPEGSGLKIVEIAGEKETVA
jgi:hypothetical protein